MLELLAAYRPVIHFVYGLSVFLMGWTIWFQPRSSSNLRLARSLPYLAASGILRGFSEWGTSYIELQESSLRYVHVPPQGVAALMALSFFFLFLFGCDLIRDLSPHSRLLPAIGLALLGIWAVKSEVFWMADLTTSPDPILVVESEVWARYLLVLPGKTLAAVGLYLQTRQFRAAGFEAMVPDLRGASVAMAVYSILAGVLVPKADLFPANLLHIELFPEMGLLIILLRSASATVVAIFLIRTLRVFDAEVRNRLERAEAARTAAEERERLGLELHDGILQSIYATGLGLEAARRRLLRDPEGGIQRVNTALERLNQAIAEIRAYIRTLTAAPGTVREVQTAVQQAVEEFQAVYEILVTFTADISPVSARMMFSGEQILPILKEALSNIGRHAEATRVDVRLSSSDGMISLSITDNGIGFKLEPALSKHGHYGLSNLQRRAETAGGSLRISSDLGRGTRIEAILPLQKGEVAS